MIDYITSMMIDRDTKNMMMNNIARKYGLEAPETIAFCDIAEASNVTKQTIKTMYSVLMSINTEEE